MRGKGCTRPESISHSATHAAIPSVVCHPGPVDSVCGESHNLPSATLVNPRVRVGVVVQVGAAHSKIGLGLVL